MVLHSGSREAFFQIFLLWVEKKKSFCFLAFVTAILCVCTECFCQWFWNEVCRAFVMESPYCPVPLCQVCNTRRVSWKSWWSPAKEWLSLLWEVYKPIFVYIFILALFFFFPPFLPYSSRKGSYNSHPTHAFPLVKALSFHVSYPWHQRQDFSSSYWPHRCLRESLLCEISQNHIRKHLSSPPVLYVPAPCRCASDTVEHVKWFCLRT